MKNLKIKKSENENLRIKKSENGKSETNYNLVTCFTYFVFYTLFFYIRTSKFWPSVVVLKFLHNLSLNCS